MKKGTGLILIIILAFVIILLAILFWKDNTSVIPQNNDTIGGQRDEHGCLGTAGYSYDDSIGACTRSWEINTPDTKRAAKIAVDSIGKQNALTVISVEPVKCPGCFNVNLEKQGAQYQIVLNNWEISK